MLMLRSGFPVYRIAHFKCALTGDDDMVLIHDQHTPPAKKIQGALKGHDPRARLHHPVPSC